MAKKPAFDYSALSLGTQTPEAEAVAALIQAAEEPASRPKRPRATATAKSQDAVKGQPYVTYLHPAGHRALKQYALDANTSVQGIIIEALEAWGKKHGIVEPIRPERTK